jgi:aspartate ammonia-lyase
VITALIPAIGYDVAAKVAREALEKKVTIKQIILDNKMLSEKEFDDLISPEAVCRLGSPKEFFK